MKELFYTVGVGTSWFLLMILLLGTRRGEHKARLSASDYSALYEIKLDPSIQDASITNVPTLYVVVRNESINQDSAARHYCIIANQYKTLVEQVRVVKENPFSTSNYKSHYTLLGECLCGDFRVR